MSLLDYWKQDKQQIASKNLQQIIGFAGEGYLRDGNSTSKEFRELLNNIPPELIQQYAHNCLEQPFKGSGYALQDVVNEIGSRLDFSVETGLYQGRPGKVGFDGIWRWGNGYAIVVEVKTTDAYRIKIETIADYRNSLVDNGVLSERKSSILMVVGREDTGELEAQIRGSRHAWGIRLISVDSLIRLMLLKQKLDDPAIIRKIYEILVPREFTKLDEIVELVFSTAEDIQEEQPDEVELEAKSIKDKTVPVSYHSECIEKVEEHIKKSFIPRTRVLYSTENNDIAIVCIVSREYGSRDEKRYWFGFHPYQVEFLSSAKKGYVALGCGTKDTVLLIEFNIFEKWLKDMNKTERTDRFYWHVHIGRQDERLMLRLREQKTIELTGYLI